MTATYIPNTSLGRIVRRCIESKTMFTDTDFSIQNLNILGTADFRETIGFDKWERLGTFCKVRKLKPEVFLAGIEPNDIKQGFLGDCYFLAALAVLASQPKRVKEMIKPVYYSDRGVYEIRLFYQGKWRYVIIDDYIPLNKAGGKLELKCILIRISSYIRAFKKL